MPGAPAALTAPHAGTHRVAGRRLHQEFTAPAAKKEQHALFRVIMLAYCYGMRRFPEYEATMAPTRSKSELPRKELDDQLGKALEATFPASDPVSVGQPTEDDPARPLNRKPPRIDKALVEKLAREAAQKHHESES